MSKRKPKMGRPPKRAADKMSERVLVSFTPADFRRLKADAQALGLPLATVLRRAWYAWRKD